MTNPPHRPSRQMPAPAAGADKGPKPTSGALGSGGGGDSNPRPPRASRPVRLSGAHAQFAADEAEKQAAIAEVMQYAVRVTRAVQLARQMESYKSRPFLLGLAATVSLTVFLYSYFARPDWVYGPDPVRISAPRHVAYTKFALYLAAQRVEASRSERGVLPASLTELDEEWPGMTYNPMGSVFELSAPGEGGPLTLRSDAPPRAFLGGSVAYLRSRGP